MFQYRMQPGDTLYSIANYFDVSVAAILAANSGLFPNRIFPGQVIFIPISGYLQQNYPWYYLSPYLFIKQPRHYWDDRTRWPREWRDRDRDHRRDDQDRWDGRERRSGGDRRDGRDGRDRRDGRGRSYMTNLNEMLTAQTTKDLEADLRRDKNEQEPNQRNGIHGVPVMQSGSLLGRYKALEPGPTVDTNRM